MRATSGTVAPALAIASIRLSADLYRLSLRRSCSSHSGLCIIGFLYFVSGDFSYRHVNSSLTEDIPEGAG